MRLFILLLLLLPFSLYAQVDTKVKKIITLYQDGKMEKALKKMENVVKKHPTAAYYELLVKMYMSRYEYYKQVSEEQMRDALMKALIGLEDKEGNQNIELQTFDTKPYLYQTLEAALRSTRLTEDPVSSVYLRVFLIDTPADTALIEGAKDALNEAEDFFMSKKYDDAILSYRKALKIDPSYYLATLHLGDAYYMLNQQDSAIHYFGIAKEMQPSLLQPRKYLVDAYAQAGKYAPSLEECIEALMVYPDKSMYMKLKDISSLMGLSLETHWFPRNFELNIPMQNQLPIKDASWNIYRNAKKDIASYCDENGILKANDITKHKYLEVYCWEKMLKKSTKLSPELTYAKQMMEEGYLDCFVFYSMFHYSTYAQFKDFTDNNAEKIRKFISSKLLSK